MNPNKRLYLFVLIALVLSTLVTAVPRNVFAGPDASEQLVRFTISNRTGAPASVKLIGPAAYILFAPGFEVAESERTEFTVERGTYTYYVLACDTEVVGTIDLIGQRTLIIPVCGNDPKTPPAVNKVNFPDPPRMHQITLENKSNTHMSITFTGPQTYIFFVGKGETREPIIEKGTYSITFAACDGSDTFAWTTRQSAHINFYCP